MLPVYSTLVPTVSRFLDDDWNISCDCLDKALAPKQSITPLPNIQDPPDLRNSLLFNLSRKHCYSNSM